MNRRFVPTRRLTEEDVSDPVEFAQYVHQIMGVPYPSIKDEAVLRKRIKEFFERYPQADYRTLCRIAIWAKGQHKRPRRIWTLIDLHRDAWSARAIPELDMSPADVELERGIAKVLETEQDPEWRRRFARAYGSGRREVFEEWRKEQSGSCQ